MHNTNTNTIFSAGSHGVIKHRTGAGDLETRRRYHCGQQRNHVLVSEAIRALSNKGETASS